MHIINNIIFILDWLEPGMKHQLAVVLLANMVPVEDKERGTGESMVEGRLVDVVKKDMQRGGVTKEDTRDRVRQRQTICFSDT